jgi:hypothetical protein
MHIFKRGTVYWVQFIHNGTRFRQSTKVKNRRDAQDIASAFRTALVKGEVGITERKRIPTFGDAMAAFLKWLRRNIRLQKEPQNDTATVASRSSNSSGMYRSQKSHLKRSKG